MTPERWQHVKDIFYAALERPPAERASFIDSACAGDEATREEISQLVSAHEETGEFLNTPAFEMAAKSLAGTGLGELAEGRVVGHYQIVRPIGVGGMGEVYLAEDLRLRRKVALKLLPTSLTNDASRVRRFELEARAASALNHPNVCMIHEVDEAEDGRHYIVMEYVDGATLRQQMERRRMEFTEVLNVVIQIATGLAAAHAVGVVHRRA
jgi:eukaryotic-like serine/threonine-protein kinase